jgi:hypothetical protein
MASLRNRALLLCTREKIESGQAICCSIFETAESLQLLLSESRGGRFFSAGVFGRSEAAARAFLTLGERCA